MTSIAPPPGSMGFPAGSVGSPPGGNLLPRGRLISSRYVNSAACPGYPPAALIGGFIIDNTPDTVPFGRELGRDAARQRLMGLEPVTFPVLRPGQDVKFSAPADVGGTYSDWTRQQLRAIAAGIGITYEQLTGDLSGVNYSSIRAGLVEVRRSLEQLIWSVFVFQFCRRVVRKWMDFAVGAGALAIPDYTRNRARYVDIAGRPQRWPWVDPLKDVMAEKAAVRAGFKSRSAVVSELGDDAEAVDREIAEDNRRAGEKDLVFDSTRGVPGHRARAARRNDDR